MSTLLKSHNVNNNIRSNVSDVTVFSVPLHHPPPSSTVRDDVTANEPGDELAGLMLYESVGECQRGRQL